MIPKENAVVLAIPFLSETNPSTIDEQVKIVPMVHDEQVVFRWHRVCPIYLAGVFDKGKTLIFSFYLYLIKYLKSIYGEYAVSQSVTG